MSRLFIFGIGGTGSRVVRALEMLLAANAGDFHQDTEIYPIIIDYDISNGDKKRTLESLVKYAGIHREIYGRKPQGAPLQGYFSTRMAEMKESLENSQSSFNLVYNPPANSRKYSDYIGHSEMTGVLTPTKELLKSLYNTSPDQEFAELEIDTTVGFRGNPNIGTVMLNDLERTREYKDFCQLCSDVEGDRVVIIGSLFGGTGSSGIPVLVNAIRNSKLTRISNVRLSTVLVCPYFSISTPDAKERKEGVIDDKIFESKTKAALHYYKETLNSKIDAIYYLGDTKKGAVDHNIGKEAQKNPAHIIEMIAALAICHFNSLPDAVLPQGTNPSNRLGEREWKYGFPFPINDKDGEGTNEIDFSKFADSTMADLRKMVAYVLANRTVREFILKNSGKAKDHNFYKLPGLDKAEDSKTRDQKEFWKTINGFAEYFDLFKEWIRELETGTGNKLTAFDFDTAELCDTTKGHPFRKRSKNWMGKEVKEPTLQPADILAAMSEQFKTHMPEGKDKELVAGDSLEYAFFDSLYKACEKTVNEKFAL